MTISERFTMSHFEPIPTHGVTKYGPNGLFSESSFNDLYVTSEYKKILETAANYSLSKKTWSSYKTAENMLIKCQDETGSNMELPLDQRDVLLFIAWSIKRGIQSRTISSYLSGIRMLHLKQGLNVPILRSDLVKQILEGRVHMDTVQKRQGNKPTRLPVTPTVLKLLKLELKSSTLSKENKRLLWAVITIAFAGGFRIHELLSTMEAKFDPLYTLLGEDIKIKPITHRGEKIETLQIKLKSQKTDRIGVDCIVDVYESNGAFCPVKAFNKWKRTTNQLQNLKPAFREDNGKPLTGKNFNKHLKQLLSNHIDYSMGNITSHSFRAGIATLMGELGYSDDEIKALGRWSSRAFETYLKLPRTKRLEMARAIGNLDI